jgi:hypothetical protein
MIAVPATASFASTASRAPSQAQIRAAIAKLQVGQPDHRVGGFNPNLTKVDSTNWSGYADVQTSPAFTEVGATWTEPAVTCTSAESLAAFWVGIDGYNTGTVEQDGTLAYCDGGTATYYDWWELYPSNDIQIVNTVSAGSSFTSTVTRSGTSYTMKVTDKSDSADSFTKHESCAAATCTDGSAEWIAEAPTSGGSVVPLSDYGTWTVSKATVSDGTKGSIKSFPDYEITMVNGTSKAVESLPGKLNKTATGFKTTWKSA